jgi:hypothetical protein
MRTVWLPEQGGGSRLWKSRRGSRSISCQSAPPGKLPIETLGLSRTMNQLLLLRFPRNRVHPTNVLPTRMKITSNNQHRRLLPSQILGPPTKEYRVRERSLRSYPINFCVCARRGRYKNGAKVGLFPSAATANRRKQLRGDLFVVACRGLKLSF